MEQQEVIGMEVRNCRKCGRLFNYIQGPPICPACKEANEKKFAEVKEYIRENNSASVPQIAKDCEVETGLIQQWIREERLVFADDSPIGINCELCGAMIKTGRLCDSCKNNMINGLNNSIKKPAAPAPAKKPAPSSGNKMRFIK